MIRYSVRPDKTYKENKERFTKIRAHSSEIVFRLVLDPGNGSVVSETHTTSLREALDGSLLGRFDSIPGNETGINIEGAAADGDTLFLGLRSPILRPNYVPVLVVRALDPVKYDIKYLDLAGRGVRGMTKYRNGFLILSGSSAYSTQSQKLFFWNGADCLPGKDVNACVLIDLGTVPVVVGANAEAIAVAEDLGDLCNFLFYMTESQMGCRLCSLSKLQLPLTKSLLT